MVRREGWYTHTYALPGSLQSCSQLSCSCQNQVYSSLSIALHGVGSLTILIIARGCTASDPAGSCNLFMIFTLSVFTDNFEQTLVVWFFYRHLIKFVLYSQFVIWACTSKHSSKYDSPTRCSCHTITHNKIRGLCIILPFIGAQSRERWFKSQHDAVELKREI